MRHFFALTLAIAGLARGMGALSATAGLITPGGGALGLAPGTLGAGGTAIAVAAITATAEYDLLTATGTEEQTGTEAWGAMGAHRRLPPMRVDFLSRQADTAGGPCHARLGARSRLDCGGLEAAPAPVSAAPQAFTCFCCGCHSRRRFSRPSPATSRRYCARAAPRSAHRPVALRAPSRCALLGA